MILIYHGGTEITEIRGRGRLAEDGERKWDEGKPCERVQIERREGEGEEKAAGDGAET